jgi:lipid A 3-O-deacylase
MLKTDFPCCYHPLRHTTQALALGLLLLSTPVNADNAGKVAQSDDQQAILIKACRDEDRLRFRGITARLENDIFAGSDQNYTSGITFAAVSRDLVGRLKTECMPAPVRLHAELIKWLDSDYWLNSSNTSHSQNVVVKFGQSIYTPKDYSRTDLILDDRPYAGLLYVGMSWNRRKHGAQNTTDLLDTREIVLGVIGPMSLAEESQNQVHAARGIDQFLGWRNQLHNEPALQLALDRKFKRYRGASMDTPGFSADAIRSVGVRLGNIETSATLGIEGRVGWNLPNDFGTYPIKPGAENRAPALASAVDLSGATQSAQTEPVPGKMRSGMHLFSTLEAKYVAHDFSLDGNLFRSSHSVTRRPWIAQAGVGISAQGQLAGRGIKMAVMHIFRTREFEQQVRNPAYGSVALSLEF